MHNQIIKAKARARARSVQSSATGGAGKGGGGSGGAAAPPGPLGPDQVLAITSGNVHVMTVEQSHELAQHLRWHLVADVAEGRLRVKSNERWIKVAERHLRVALLGLRWPGEPFGDSAYKWAYGLTKLEQPVFRSYVRTFAQLIQGSGHLRGPYIFCQYLGKDNPVSSSPYGYVFDVRWNYLVLSRYDLPLHGAV